MKIKHIFFIIFVYFYAFPARSQQKELPNSLSLEDAISIAIENSNNLKVKAFNSQIALEKVGEAQYKLIPSVYANYDLQRNLIIQTTVVPANAFNSSAPAGELTPLRFGTNWSSTIGLNASVKVFDASIYGNIKEKKAEAKLAATEQALSKVELEAELSLAYIECVIALVQIDLAADDTLNSSNNLKAIKEKLDNGRVKITDFQQAKIDFNNATSRLSEANKVFTIAKTKLIYYLGYAQQEITLSFKDNLQTLYAKFSQMQKDDYEFKNSLSFTKLNQQIDINQIRLENTKKGFLPTLSLNGFYGGNYFNNQFKITNTDYWFGNSFVALSLRVPITEGIDRKKRMNQLQLQAKVEAQNLNADFIKKDYEWAKVKQEVAFAEKELKIKEANMQLAEKNYQLSLQLFQEGRIVATELSQADFLYKQAKNSYLQISYNYIQAVIQQNKIKKS